MSKREIKEDVKKYKKNIKKLERAKSKWVSKWKKATENHKTSVSDMSTQEIRKAMITCKLDYQELMLAIRKASIPSKKEEKERKETYEKLIKIKEDIFKDAELNEIWRGVQDAVSNTCDFRSQMLSKYLFERDKKWNALKEKNADEYAKFSTRMDKLDLSSAAWKVAALAHEGFATNVLEAYFAWEQAFGRYAFALEYSYGKKIVKEKETDKKDDKETDKKDDKESKKDDKEKETNKEIEIDSVHIADERGAYGRVKYEEDKKFLEHAKYIYDAPFEEEKRSKFKTQASTITAYVRELSIVIGDIKALDESISTKEKELDELKKKAGTEKERKEIRRRAHNLAIEKKHRDIFKDLTLERLEKDLKEINAADFKPDKPQVKMRDELKKFCAVTEELISFGFLTLTAPKFIPNPPDESQSSSAPKDKAKSKTRRSIDKLRGSFSKATKAMSRNKN